MGEAYIIGYIVGAVLWGVVWGAVTKKVIDNKGYSENWFWWGFFFGFFALIVALSKPEAHNYSKGSSRNRALSNLHDYESSAAVSGYGTSAADMHPGDFVNGYWKCSCRNLNPANSGVCSQCGTSLSEIRNQRRVLRSAQDQSATEIVEAAAGDNFDKLKKCKELLDIGAITQSEYEEKKKELLGL